MSQSSPSSDSSLWVPGRSPPSSFQPPPLGACPERAGFKGSRRGPQPLWGVSRVLGAQGQWPAPVWDLPSIAILKPPGTMWSREKRRLRAVGGVPLRCTSPLRSDWWTAHHPEPRGASICPESVAPRPRSSRQACHEMRTHGRSIKEMPRKDGFPVITLREQYETNAGDSNLYHSPLMLR